MLTALEIYGRDKLYHRYGGEEPSFDAPGDYAPIIESFGEVLLSQDIGLYQGDTLAIIKDGKRYGFLCFGWGSCSGCDSLQACDSEKELDELIAHLHGQIKWGTKQELREYLETYDLKGKWYGEEEGAAEFRDAAVAALA